MFGTSKRVTIFSAYKKFRFLMVTFNEFVEGKGKNIRNYILCYSTGTWQNWASFPFTFSSSACLRQINQEFDITTATCSL